MNGVYSGVEAMVANQSRLDMLAHNLANSQTTAYKRQDGFVQALERESGRGKGKARLDIERGTDFSQGPLIQTGSPLHFALEGQGFFAVEGPEGESYTRDGSFTVDEEGTLLSASGHPLVWDRQQGAIDPIGSPIDVDAAGVVSQDGRDIGQLRLADFEDRQQLYLDGFGNFRAPLEVLETAHSAVVRQGALEGSNVNPLEEMVSMISVQRAFAGASNVLGMINETYRRLSRAQ